MSVIERANIVVQRIRLETIARLMRQGKWQLIALTIFCILNVSLFWVSVGKFEDGIFYHGTYWNASDGQRYWGAAIDLAERGQFTMQPVDHEPLSRAGPIPAIVFAIPIKLIGFDNAAAVIVGVQCVLLFIMGMLTAEIGKIVGVSGRGAQGLVMFNPNLIGLAHHAQSDLIFAFIFTLLLFIGTRMIKKIGVLKIKDYVILGLVSGCLPLARAAGQYYVLFLPCILTIGIFLSTL